MNQVFKNGKLYPTIKNPSQLVQLCMQNVNERQQALLKKYGLDQLKAYSINEDKGTMTFILKDDSTHEFDIVPIGVWNSKANQWAWAWANSENGAVLYARSAALKGLSDIIESTDFTEALIECDAHKSQMISCIATEYIGGNGRFIAPQGDYRMHFIIMEYKA